MLRRDVLDASSSRRSNWMELESRFLLVSRLVLRLGTNGMRRLDFAPNSVIDSQLMLNRDVQVANDIRRSSLLEHGILSQISTSVLR